MSSIQIKKMTYTAILTALLCVLSPLSVPIGPIPLTLGFFAVFLVSSVANWGIGLVAVALYILIGAFGIPVFSNFRGGFDVLAGPTGGYIVGYIPMALVIGLTLKLFKRKLWAYPVGMVLGAVICYLFGTVWYSIQSGTTFLQSLMVCVAPFWLWDMVKVILASMIVPPVNKALKKQFDL